MLNAWNGSHTSLNVGEKDSPLRLRVPKLPDIHMNVEDTFGSKAKIRTLRFQQAPHEQPGCGEKNEAGSDLGRHEEIADPMTVGAR
jgi:hypothetical protein